MITKSKINKYSKLPVLLSFGAICAMTIFRNNPGMLTFLSGLLAICTLLNIIGIIREYKGFEPKHLMLIISLLVTITVMVLFLLNSK